jgi:hypothetical protein
MRDFMKKEVVFYNIFNKLESVFIPSLGTKVTFLYVSENYISGTDLSMVNWFTGFKFFFALCCIEVTDYKSVMAL